jgi:hypothetical protein
MKKFLVIGAVVILSGLGAVSCGTDTPFDAKLVMPTLVAPGAQACGDLFGYPNLQVKVTTADGKQPVSGATVDIVPIGGGGFTYIFSDLGLTNPIAGTDPSYPALVHMTTDKSGAVYVNFGMVFGGTTPTTFTATFGFTATISGAQQSVSTTASVSC